MDDSRKAARQVLRLLALRPRPPGGVTMCSRKSLSRLIALQEKGGSKEDI